MWLFCVQLVVLSMIACPSGWFVHALNAGPFSTSAVTESHRTTYQPRFLLSECWKNKQCNYNSFFIFYLSLSQFTDFSSSWTVTDFYLYLENLCKSLLGSREILFFAHLCFNPAITILPFWQTSGYLCISHLLTSHRSCCFLNWRRLCRYSKQIS